jgi:hypothetical protein
MPKRNTEPNDLGLAECLRNGKAIASNLPSNFTHLRLCMKLSSWSRGVEVTKFEPLKRRVTPSTCERPAENQTIAQQGCAAAQRLEKT